jgi:hypothetical protein
MSRRFSGALAHQFSASRAQARLLLASAQKHASAAQAHCNSRPHGRGNGMGISGSDDPRAKQTAFKRLKHCSRLN